MSILAQAHPSGIARVFESAPTHEIMVICVVATVFTSVLLAIITFCVTSTIRSIKTTSINAKLTQQLVKEGVDVEDIERLVKANQRRLVPSVTLPSKWKRATPKQRQVADKPAPLRSAV